MTSPLLRLARISGSLAIAAGCLALSAPIATAQSSLTSTARHVRVLPSPKPKQIVTIPTAPRTAQAPVLDPYAQFLKDVRARIVARKPVSYEDMQTLADSGDSLGAYLLARRIEGSGRPDLADNAAHYYALAAFSGRAGAVRPLVKLLDAAGETFKASLLRDAEAALQIHARKDNAVAIDALARYFAAGTPFGLDPEQAQQLLSRSASAGNTKAALDLAIELLAGTPTDAERGQALRYLEIAAASEALGTRAMAENLIRQLRPAVAEITPVPATRKVPQ